MKRRRSLRQVCVRALAYVMLLGGSLVAGTPALQPPPKQAVAPAPTPPTHPLDPLTAVEIEQAAKLARSAQGFPDGGLFATVALKEPPKDDVLSFKPGATFGRRAFVVVLDRPGNRTFEGVVDLTAGRVATWTQVPDVQPAVLESEYELLDRLCKENAEWQAAMRKRGIEDFSQVQVDGWAVGQVDRARRGPRMLRGVSYLKGGQTNFYGRPIEGVVALVNMNTRQVIEVVDTGIVPMPPASQELTPEAIKPREAPKPLAIVQPEGPGFQIDGHQVSWQKWRFRYSLHPREGLVLHTVGYEDDGRLRPILYRVSLSEMAVPYGDPGRNWRWRSAFDVGEYNVGLLASSIEPGTDAPDNATLLDAAVANEQGSPSVLNRVVGIYERDGGMLWKHYDLYSKVNQSRRARQLVIFFIATIGNYDYAINYVFHQDGVLEVDAALSGIMLPKGVASTKVEAHAGPQTGHLVAANVVAPNHQHFFNFRLDFDVDGTSNSVHEMNTRALLAGSTNPSLNGFAMEETRLRTEREARRSISLASARTWMVVNAKAHNSLGHPSSYVLVPGSSALPYIALSSEVRRRAGFIDQHFWATRHNQDEMNAAGPYPNQSRGGDGLPRWSGNESLVDQDVVVWYTFGITHIPRPEEWPIMSATHVGFRMLPAGFFARNPGLDVPR